MIRGWTRIAKGWKRLTSPRLSCREVGSYCSFLNPSFYGQTVRSLEYLTAISRRAMVRSQGECGRLHSVRILLLRLGYLIAELFGNALSRMACDRSYSLIASSYLPYTRHNVRKQPEEQRHKIKLQKDGSAPKRVPHCRAIARSDHGGNMPRTRERLHVACPHHKTVPGNA